MSERLEIFIKEHRKELDQFDPPADLWDKIEKQLDEDPKFKAPADRVVKISTLLKVAAVFVFAFVGGLLIYQNENRNQADLTDIDPELAKKQLYYSSVIEEKRSALQRIQNRDPLLYKEFSSEIKIMDENYQKLKRELPASPNQEEVVKAMIRNLQIQLQVLNQQLQIIEQVDQFKNQKDETESI